MNRHEWRSYGARFTAPRGESHYAAKLTEGQVACIRSLQGIVSKRVLALTNNVSEAAIQQIWSGRSWPHVKGVDMQHHKSQFPPEYKQRALLIADRGGYTALEVHEHLMDEGKYVPLVTVSNWLRERATPPSREIQGSVRGVR